jgi:hypothetical protein
MLGMTKRKGGGRYRRFRARILARDVGCTEPACPNRSTQLHHDPALVEGGQEPSTLGPRFDSLVRVVGRTTTDTPEAELLRPRSLGEKLQAVRVPASAVPVEVGGGGTDGDEADVHVDAVADTDDVAQQPPVLIDAVGCWLREEADPCAGGSSVLVRSEAALP